MSNRKSDHIKLAYQSRIDSQEILKHFDYEPIIASFSDAVIPESKFVGKTMRYPIWISSMTGGTKLARTINHNLARAVKEFGIGMGLGSCRCLLSSDACFDDFDVRDIMGESGVLSGIRFGI